MEGSGRYGPTGAAPPDDASIAFARTGYPEYAVKGPHWPAYDAKYRAMVVINIVSKVVNDMLREQRIGGSHRAELDLREPDGKAKSAIRLPGGPYSAREPCPTQSSR